MQDRSFKIFVLFFCFKVLGFSQAPFNNYYNAGATTKSYANQIITEASDTSYLVYAPWQNQTAQQGLRLLRLNKNGVSVLDNKFLFGNLNFATYLNNKLAIQTSSCTSLAIGDTYFGNDRGLIFCKINNKLADTIHTRKYCDNVYAYYLNDRFLKETNKVWYVGSKFKENDNNYTTRPVFFKVDTNGNYLGQFEIPALMNFVPNTAYFDNIDKKVYLAGQDYSLQQNNKARVVCVDTLGVIVWNQLQNDPMIFTQMEKRNNNLVISGHKNVGVVGGFTQFRMTLLKLDCNNNGTTIWQKSYANHGIINSFSSFIINSDESIIASGTFKYPHVIVSPMNDGVIFKVNSAGDSLWMKTYGIYSNPIQEMFYDIKRSPDGGYVMCGSPDYLPTSQSWVVKTDSLGMAPGISTNLKESSFALSSSTVKFYPNPIHDKLFMQTEEEVKVNIIDVLGKSVFEEQINGVREIDLSAQAKGIYLLIVSSDKETMTHKLIIE